MEGVRNMKEWKVWVEYEYWLWPECDGIYYSYASAERRAKELVERYPDIRCIWIEDVC